MTTTTTLCQSDLDGQPTTTKRCPGVPSLSIDAHDATTDEFGRDSKAADGLYRTCKACDKAYQKAARERKEVPVTKTTTTAVEPTLRCEAMTNSYRSRCGKPAKKVYRDNRFVGGEREDMWVPVCGVHARQGDTWGRTILDFDDEKLASIAARHADEQQERARRTEARAARREQQERDMREQAAREAAEEWEAGTQEREDYDWRAGKAYMVTEYVARPVGRENSSYNPTAKLTNRYDQTYVDLTGLGSMLTPRQARAVAQMLVMAADAIDAK